MKDHELAKLTNELTEIAKVYGETQQLSQRISNKLQEYIKTDNSKTISITVPDIQIKKNLIDESEYIHYHRKIDIDKCSTLAHLYMLPEDAWVVLSNDLNDDAVSIPVSKKVKMKFGKPKRMEFPGGD